MGKKHKEIRDVYLVYIFLPDKVYKKTDGMNYITNHFDYNKGNDTWSGLYGFTFDKKAVKKFMDIHNKKYFKVKHVTEEDDRFDQLLAELTMDKNDVVKIDKHAFFTEGSHNVYLYTTKFEKYISSQDDIDDTNIVIFKDCVTDKKISKSLPEPYVFNNEIYKALVSLGYEWLFYNFFYSPMEDEDDFEYEDETYERYQIFQYNSGYNLSMTGDFQVNLPVQDQLKVLILLFSSILDTEG